MFSAFEYITRPLKKAYSISVKNINFFPDVFAFHTIRDVLAGTQRAHSFKSASKCAFLHSMINKKEYIILKR